MSNLNSKQHETSVLTSPQTDGLTGCPLSKESLFLFQEEWNRKAHRNRQLLEHADTIETWFRHITSTKTKEDYDRAILSFFDWLNTEIFNGKITTWPTEPPNQ